MTDSFCLPWVQLHHFPLLGLVLVWNSLLTADHNQAWLCNKQTKLTRCTSNGMPEPHAEGGFKYGPRCIFYIFISNNNLENLIMELILLSVLKGRCAATEKQRLFTIK